MINLEIDPRKPDIKLSADDAMRVQEMSIEVGDVLIWTVTWNTLDYPDQVVARPHSTLQQAPYRAVLSASSLDELRALLPPTLSCLARSHLDDSVIVETWI